MTATRLFEGQQVRLLTKPEGYTSQHLPLTAGNTYVFLRYDGSNVVTTTDVPGETGSYWQGRVEPIVAKS